MIKLVALDPYGHWNFKPAAEDMWTFLSRFRCDPTTGALPVDPIRDSGFVQRLSSRNPKAWSVPSFVPT